MIWNIAAGIIIGGGSLGLIVFGLTLAVASQRQRDENIRGFGLVGALAGVAAVAWIIFFKAHIL
jgi:hypothetical protein